MYWHFVCLQMSTLCLSASLQCFPSDDVFLIFALGSVSRYTVPTVPIHSLGSSACIGYYDLCDEYWQCWNQYFPDNDERMFSKCLGVGVFWQGHCYGDLGKLDHKLQQRWAGVRVLDTGILLLGRMIDPAYNRLWHPAT